MAGAGYKLFNTGDVLTAAQVNTYLQEQAVMRFANAAARTSALSGVLAEGMVSYLMDTDAVEVYNGSAWVGVATGDITAVTAGTGLSGGGTSGAVTLSLTSPVVETNGGTNQTTYTTGDLLYASASNTLAKRAIGTSGQVLTVSGGVPTWATPAGGGGKVLQVVSSVTTTSTAINGTTLTDTTISATITPSATSSKVLVLVTGNYYADTDNATASGIKMALLRGATTIWDGGNNTHYYSVLTAVKMQMNLNYLDSPSTTSATTYKIQSAEQVAANHTMVWQEGSQPSIITLLEIGA